MPCYTPLLIINNKLIFILFISKATDKSSFNKWQSTLFLEWERANEALGSDHEEFWKHSCQAGRIRRNKEEIAPEDSIDFAVCAQRSSSKHTLIHFWVSRFIIPVSEGK